MIPKDKLSWLLNKFSQMKGPVEKGRKWRFVVKIEIAPI